VPDAGPMPRRTPRVQSARSIFRLGGGDAEQNEAHRSSVIAVPLKGGVHHFVLQPGRSYGSGLSLMATLWHESRRTTGVAPCPTTCFSLGKRCLALPRIISVILVGPCREVQELSLACDAPSASETSVRHRYPNAVDLPLQRDPPFAVYSRSRPGVSRPLLVTHCGPSSDWE
jgi:hypothetical protein